MRILVADDDPVCRKVLTSLLHRAQHEAVPFLDGASALAALLAQDAPAVAILDWMMPGLGGLDVCARLRAANLRLRPYVIIHSARREKEDIVTGLDSGADDYLPKPVNSAELLARLRVAERTMTYQRELNQHIEEMELLFQRYNLLGEIVGRQTRETGVFPVTPTVAGIPTALTDSEIEGVVVQTLTELGLGETNGRLVAQSGPYIAAPFTAWVGIILPKEHIWMDLLLEASRAEMEKLCEKSLHRAGNGEELQGVLAETQTILCAALKSAIQTKGGKVLAPLLSRVRFTQTVERTMPLIPDRRSYAFNFGDCSLGLTLVINQCRPRRKEPEQLRPLDILAEPVFLSGMPGMPLFGQGTILNQRYIERLATMALDETNGILVTVFEPSEIARYFCR
jgi:sigma-B regulation protein RsbU (phosphoserine phosphatase)